GRRADAGALAPGGYALRGHGGGPAGWRNLLPLPDTTEPRLGRSARAPHGGGARGGGWRAHPPGGAPRARRVSVTDRPAAGLDRSRDPATPGRGSRPRGHGPHAPQAAAGGRGLH